MDPHPLSVSKSFLLPPVSSMKSRKMKVTEQVSYVNLRSRFSRKPNNNRKLSPTPSEVCLWYSYAMVSLVVTYLARIIRVRKSASLLVSRAFWRCPRQP